MAPGDRRPCPDKCNTCRCGGGGGLSMTLLSCKIEVREQIYFAHNDAALTADALKLIEAIAEVLLKLDVKLEVEGHAAQGEARPLRLSKARARVVLEALTARGVPAARLRPVAFAAEHPISLDEPERNRRASFRVIEKQEPLNENR